MEEAEKKRRPSDPYKQVVPEGFVKYSVIMRKDMIRAYRDLAYTENVYVTRMINYILLSYLESHDLEGAEIYGQIIDTEKVQVLQDRIFPLWKADLDYASLPESSVTKNLRKRTVYKETTLAHLDDGEMRLSLVVYKKLLDLAAAYAIKSNIPIGRLFMMALIEYLKDFPDTLTHRDQAVFLNDKYQYNKPYTDQEMNELKNNIETVWPEALQNWSKEKYRKRTEGMETSSLFSSKKD